MTVDLRASAPEWLLPPDDVNRLSPELWSRTLRRGPSGELEVGGVGMADLAARFGTPLYVFDEEDFRTSCARFRRDYHDFDVYYAGKAFLCKTVARIIAETGLSLDVCSGGELAVAEAAGMPMDRVLMHGNNKSDDELARAVRAGVGRIVVDSFSEIERLTEIAAGHDRRPAVLVRATVGVTANTHRNIATAHDDQKFGFGVASGEAAEAVRLILRSGRLDLRGLHSHIGSQILDLDGFTLAARRALDLLAEIAAEHGVALPELNLGGGLGIAYTSADRPLAPGVLAGHLRTVVSAGCADLGLPPPRLAVEPGRSIVGRSGCTLYRVGTVKPRAGLRTYVAVDGGMSDNIRPALYDGVYSARVAGRVSPAGPMLSRVVGKHCDAGDVVVRDDYLPADLRRGDLLAVPGTGAYCRSLAHNYNHVPRPPVVAVRDGQARVIVRGETEADLLRLDVG